MTDTLEAKIQSIEVRLRALEQKFENDGPIVMAKSRKQSAREFLTTKKAVAETQKVLVFAYFLEHYEGLQSFNVLDLDAAFRSARELPPKNINDTVNKNVARGLIMEAREKKNSKKAWQLTATGEQFVEQKL